MSDARYAVTRLGSDLKIYLLLAVSPRSEDGDCPFCWSLHEGTAFVGVEEHELAARLAVREGGDVVTVAEIDQARSLCGVASACWSALL